MSEEHYLVQRGSLDVVLHDLIEKQKTVIADAERCLPLMQDGELIKKFQKQKAQAEAQLQALEAGYVPVVGGWFWDVDTKARWGKGAVKAIMETMPEEVKAVLEETRASGTFKKIKVSGRGVGDPMLVGTAGGKNFLLALWCTFEGGYSVGFTVRNRRKQE